MINNLARRYLGNKAVGPTSPSDIGAHLKYALPLMSGSPATGYYEYKQRCESARVIAFYTMTSLLSASLIFKKPQLFVFKRLRSPLRIKNDKPTLDLTDVIN